jgi:uncharacterized protein YehS (DUF1456 family)
LTNNDILRRIRTTFDYKDQELSDLFAQADCDVSEEQVAGWLKPDDDPDLQPCSDQMLTTLLNGLINNNRGRKDGPQPETNIKLSNNIILKKMKIALDLQNDDILEIMSLADYEINKHELSALLRKPGNKHYRECKDEVLKKFLHGVRLAVRAEDE